MKLTIGVMGASGGDLSESVRRKAYGPGEAIAVVVSPRGHAGGPDRVAAA